MATSSIQNCKHILQLSTISWRNCRRTGLPEVMQREKRMSIQMRARHGFCLPVLACARCLFLMLNLAVVRQEDVLDSHSARNIWQGALGHWCNPCQFLACKVVHLRIAAGMQDITAPQSDRARLLNYRCDCGGLNVERGGTEHQEVSNLTHGRWSTMTY